MIHTRLTSLFLLLLWRVPLSGSSFSHQCTLQCAHNTTTCIEGPANFTWHPLRSDTGDPLPFHAKPMDPHGWHCDCPEGWTGLQCEHQYEVCYDGHYNRHVCYNGGQCIATMRDIYQNDQQFCDCQSITDENGNTKLYSGKYCEVEIDTSRCGRATGPWWETINPCHNGGICKKYVDELNPCDCPIGYVGRNCEYFEPSVPVCSLDCQHGGTCRLGTKVEHTAGSKNATIVVHHNYMHCECPYGYTGVYCEETLCGNLTCQSGAKCITQQNPDTNEPSYLCEESTNNNNDLGASYSFSTCALDCQNGGHCRQGSKQRADPQVEELVQTYGSALVDKVVGLNANHTTDWEHCACPTGYVGLVCEYSLLETCGDMPCFLVNINGTLDSTAGRVADNKGGGGFSAAEIVVIVVSLSLLCFAIMGRSYYAYRDWKTEKNNQKEMEFISDISADPTSNSHTDGSVASVEDQVVVVTSVGGESTMEDDVRAAEEAGERRGMEPDTVSVNSLQLQNPDGDYQTKGIVGALLTAWFHCGGASCNTAS